MPDMCGGLSAVRQGNNSSRPADRRRPGADTRLPPERARKRPPPKPPVTLRIGPSGGQRGQGRGGSRGRGTTHTDTPPPAHHRDTPAAPRPQHGKPAPVRGKQPRIPPRQPPPHTRNAVKAPDATVPSTATRTSPGHAPNTANQPPSGVRSHGCHPGNPRHIPATQQSPGRHTVPHRCAIPACAVSATENQPGHGHDVTGLQAPGMRICPVARVASDGPGSAPERGQEPDTAPGRVSPAGFAPFLPPTCLRVRRQAPPAGCAAARPRSASRPASARRLAPASPIAA